MPNAELVTAARFRRHVAMATVGVVCIGVVVIIARRLNSYASICECDLSVMLRQGCCRLPRLGL
jgi:hypothetical protein